MKITLQLDDKLLFRAQRDAAQTGRTLEQVIENALRNALALRLPTFNGTGTLTGVDLDDSAGLRDLMDE